MRASGRNRQNMKPGKKTDLDSPAITIRRRSLVERKRFLKKIYGEWYQLLQSALPENSAINMELGSGSGVIDRFIPGTITSDIMTLPFVDVVLDGISLPVASACLDSLLLVNVFHHIPDVREFLHESVRVLKPGGRVIMIEPWVNSWSRWIYTNFHHEQLGISYINWEFQTSGPLSGSNQALPWIVFKRDISDFEAEFPQLAIKTISPLMPVTYLLSGGFSTRLSFPGFMYRFWRWVEQKILNSRKSGMFALIVLERN